MLNFKLSATGKTKAFAKTIPSHLNPWELEDSKPVKVFCNGQIEGVTLKTINVTGVCLTINLFNQTIYQASSHSQAIKLMSENKNISSFYDKRGLVYGWLKNIEGEVHLVLDCHLFPFSKKTQAEMILACRLLGQAFPQNTPLIFDHPININYETKNSLVNFLKLTASSLNKNKIYIGESIPTLFIHPFLTNDVLPREAVDILQIKKILAEDIPQAVLVNDHRNQPLVWQFHKNHAVTQPYYLVIDIPGEKRRAMIMKPYNDNENTKSYNHYTEEYIGYEFLELIHGKTCKIYRGKKYQYIEMFNGLEFTKFLREIKKNAHAADLEKTFYCLGRAYADSFVLGITDRYKDGSSNMMVDVDDFMNFSIAEIKEFNKNPIGHIDLASALGYVFTQQRVKHLALAPQLDQEFYEMSEMVLKDDFFKNKSFFKNGFNDRMQSIYEIYIQSRKVIKPKLRKIDPKIAKSILKRIYYVLKLKKRSEVEAFLDINEDYAQRC